jgi:mono/diheme cytochrome c family protein
LPILGARLSEFPEGPGKTIADKACLQCHSADIPRQQRITEKQWTAEIEKMTRWGADVSASDKDALIAYLASRFGPANDAFHPVEVRPTTASAPRPPAAGR